MVGRCCPPCRHRTDAAVTEQPVHGPLAVLQAHAGQLHLHEKAHVVQNSSTTQVEQGNVTTVVGIVMGVHPALFHSNLLFLEVSGIY